MDEKNISSVCSQLREIQSIVKNLKKEARAKLSECEDQVREHRKQMQKAVYLTNAEQLITGALEYLKELC